MIPIDRYITNIDKLNATTVINEFKLLFPDINLDCLQVVGPILQDIFNLLKDDDVLLVPGDSPFKFSQVLKINHRIDDNHYKFNGIIKKFTIIDFPLSGREWEHDLLDRYISNKLLSLKISLHNHFVLFDYVDQGTSYLSIRNSLARLKNKLAPIIDISKYYYGLPYIPDDILSLIRLSPNWYQSLRSSILSELPFDFDFGTLDKEGYELITTEFERQLNPCYSFTDDVISGAETTNSRCVPKYNLSTMIDLPRNAPHSWLLDLPRVQSTPGIFDLPKNAEHSWLLDLPKDSLYRCNLIIAVMALIESGEVII